MGLLGPDEKKRKRVGSDGVSLDAALGVELKTNPVFMNEMDQSLVSSQEHFLGVGLSS